MIRVVLDTNILISALLSPQGQPAQVFLMTILDPDMQLCVSGNIFAEYEEVIRRPRFNRSDSEIATVLRTIRDGGVWAQPHREGACLLRSGRRYILGMRAGCRSALPRDRQCQAFSRRMAHRS
jgi:predicted nucleic acid-binding protein